MKNEKLFQVFLPLLSISLMNSEQPKSKRSLKSRVVAPRVTTSGRTPRLTWPKLGLVYVQKPPLRIVPRWTVLEEILKLIPE